jgi:cellulose synthase/poly-beta-1,6-N-acetylglucosamine synthase-like glycosyltransferase
MGNFGLSLALILVALAIGQGLLVVALIRTLRNFGPDRHKPPETPRAAILLCLRGRDPFLEKCLESLLTQDYPNYQVRIVVDNPQDPSLPVAKLAVERYGADRVSIEILEQRLETCSLKCSSVVQAIEHLDDAFQVIALADADTTPHPSWLRDLTVALADEGIGAATGNRWYMPETNAWGAMVRYLWNAAAIVQMYWYEVPWGGTLAVPRQAIDRASLLDRWRNALCEDTMLYRQLGKHGLRVRFVPSLMMVNREDCGLGACLSWIRRQLLTMRLYHPHWPLVLLHGFGTTFLLAFAVAATVVAAVRHDWSTASWCGGGLVAYEAIMVGLLAPLELSVRRIVQSRGEPTRWISAKTVLRLVPAIVLTQIVYTCALLGAQFAKNVGWRGITYHIGGSWRIRRLDDRPYSSDSSDTDEGHSL